jgi:hypothetical protein
MKAMACPAADNTQPAVDAVTTTTVPATSETPPTNWPDNVRLTRAPSDARSNTHTVAWPTALTVTTVSAAPLAKIATGAATDTTTGSIDNALSSDASLCARAADMASKHRDSAVINRVFFMVLGYLHAGRGLNKAPSSLGWRLVSIPPESVAGYGPLGIFKWYLCIKQTKTQKADSLMRALTKLMFNTAFLVFFVPLVKNRVYLPHECKRHR